jgi:hypothetical protein
MSCRISGTRTKTPSSGVKQTKLMALGSWLPSWRLLEVLRFQASGTFTIIGSGPKSQLNGRQRAPKWPIIPLAQMGLQLIYLPIVRSDGDGRWYPTERLPVTKGSWQIPENSICPAPGSQELVIYSIPDSEEGPLFAYLNSKAGRNGLGMNSVPIGSIVMASATVNVAKSKIAGC